MNTSRRGGKIERARDRKPRDDLMMELIDAKDQTNAVADRSIPKDLMQRLQNLLNITYAGSTYIHTYGCTHMPKHVDIHTYIQTYIHTQTCRYIHTYIHTYRDIYHLRIDISNF
jgi:hypothetical protein